MITYNDIYEALRKEKYSEQLQILNKGFISEVARYLKDKQEISKKDEELFSDETAKMRKQLENARAIFNELMLLRKKKILALVFVVSETGVSKRDSETMLDFEKELFDNLIGSVDVAEKRLAEEFASEVKPNDMSLILFLEDLGELAGFGGASLGPFQKGEIVNLPRKVADILVIDGRAEFIDGK